MENKTQTVRLRIPSIEKEEWQEIAERDFGGNLSRMIRIAVVQLIDGGMKPTDNMKQMFWKTFENEVVEAPQWANELSKKFDDLTNKLDEKIEILQSIGDTKELDDFEF